MRSFNNVAALIKSYREKTNPRLSQSEISKLLGYKNGQFISNVERGLCSIPAKSVAKLSDVIKAPREDIIEAMVKDYRESITNISSK